MADDSKKVEVRIESTADNKGFDSTDQALDKTKAKAEETAAAIKATNDAQRNYETVGKRTGETAEQVRQRFEGAAAPSPATPAVDSSAADASRLLGITGAAVVAGKALADQIAHAADEMVRMAEEGDKQAAHLVKQAQLWREQAANAHDLHDVVKLVGETQKEEAAIHERTIALQQKELTTWQKLTDAVVNHISKTSGLGENHFNQDNLNQAREQQERLEQIAGASARASILAAERSRQAWEEALKAPGEAIPKLAAKIDELKEKQGAVNLRTNDGRQAYFEYAKQLEAATANHQKLIAVQGQQIAHSDSLIDRLNRINEAVMKGVEKSIEDMGKAILKDVEHSDQLIDRLNSVNTTFLKGVEKAVEDLGHSLLKDIAHSDALIGRLNAVNESFVKGIERTVAELAKQVVKEDEVVKKRAESLSSFEQETKLINARAAGQEAHIHQLERESAIHDHIKQLLRDGASPQEAQTAASKRDEANERLRRKQFQDPKENRFIDPATGKEHLPDSERRFRDDRDRGKNFGKAFHGGAGAVDEAEVRSTAESSTGPIKYTQAPGNSSGFQDAFQHPATAPAAQSQGQGGSGGGGAVEAAASAIAAAVVAALSKQQPGGDKGSNQSELASAIRDLNSTWSK